MKSKSASSTADHPFGAAAPCGRFAPSPTGALHLGSLATALASYLDIKARNGHWLVRIDDLDTQRNVPGAADTILSTLQAHGLEWDGPVQYQSERIALYAAHLQRLEAAGLTYACACSRRLLIQGAPYPGTCRHLGLTTANNAIRVIVPESARINFQDDLQGAQSAFPAESTGDFVIFRRDGVVAYLLAAAVDDGQQDITHVLRGEDLLESTPAQLYLMDMLGLTRPQYSHIPLLYNTAGDKLSKQNGAAAVDTTSAAQNLALIFSLFGMSPPQRHHWGVSDWLTWGLEHWCAQTLPRRLPPVPELIETNSR